ncbi:MAG: DUF5011 domain-containing protein [Bacilli bacterium]|nr:DUF5011 domain-containing protein [Bacilli bacterium]
MNKNVKRFLSIIGLVLISLILTGCVKEPTLKLSQTEITMELGSTFDLSSIITLENVEEGTKVKYIYDETTLEIQDNVVFVKKTGEREITVRLENYPDVEPQKIKILVTDLKDFDFVGPTSLKIGESATYEVVPQSLGITSMVSDDPEILKVEGLTAYALKEGKTFVYVSYYDSYRVVNVEVTKDDVSPTIESSVEENITISWNEKIDIFEGITVTDNIDKDITLTLKEEFNNQKMGEQTLTYIATDSSGNTTTLERKVNVIWDYGVKFIGHAGSFYGVMNSEEAILYAIQTLQYQAVEVDLKQTQDGVFVLCHDDKFGDYTIANTNYSFLKDVEETKTRYTGYPAQNGSVKNRGVYTTKICTLERYLEICKEYGVTAVIELKSSKGITNSDQSRMQALMDVIEKCDMLDNVIFLASQYNCLIWTRQNGYEDIRCQYLVNSCESEEYLQRCIDNKLDISFNATGNYTNSVEWINKYKAEGCEVSCYTFTQWSNYKDVQTWINNGVDYVTCDWHLMSKLTLPKDE